MIDNDTVRLLRECSSGARMGIDSFDEVLPKTESGTLSELLKTSREEHVGVLTEVNGLLEEYGDEGKAPETIAQSMSWLKTEASLMFDHSDGKIASLMTDGCDMGVKSLSRYLNQYAAASEQAKDLAKTLIKSEERLGKELRDYL